MTLQDEQMIADDTRVLASVDSFYSLICALRAGFEHRKISPSSKSAAQVAGLPDRWMATVLGPIRNLKARRLQATSFDSLLGVIGCKLLLVEDPEAWAKVCDRLVEKKPNLVRADTTHIELSHRFMQGIRSKGGKARAAKLGKARCQQSARNAALARWADGPAAKRRAKAIVAAQARHRSRLAAESETAACE